MTHRKGRPIKPGDEAKVLETAFNTWLERGLHELFDDVTKEPIPDALLRLIRDDGKS